MSDPVRTADDRLYQGLDFSYLSLRDECVRARFVHMRAPDQISNKHHSINNDASRDPLRQLIRSNVRRPCPARSCGCSNGCLLICLGRCGPSLGFKEGESCCSCRGSSNDHFERLFLAGRYASRPAFCERDEGFSNCTKPVGLAQIFLTMYLASETRAFADVTIFFDAE